MDTSELFDVFDDTQADGQTEKTIETATTVTSPVATTPSTSSIKRKQYDNIDSSNGVHNDNEQQSRTDNTASHVKKIKRNESANDGDIVDLTSFNDEDDSKEDSIISTVKPLHDIASATHTHPTSPHNDNDINNILPITLHPSLEGDEVFNHYQEQYVDRWIVGENQSINDDNATNDNGNDANNKSVNPTAKTCIAEICYPPNYPIDKMVRPPAPRLSDSPAKTYNYTLDPFQVQSISCLERYESVLVSAHTSAGKTTVAEYAIAMSLRSNQRVIYTSPIKALSNQKYRELQEEFGDVGLMTGDITINPSASCLVMTTEILRNMLYKGSEMMREIAWVIFDEIHYMKNKERGVVWEESFILLPSQVRFVLLSATIPNASEFACWIAKLHNQPCNVVYTDYRPTPLQHYIYPSGAEGLYLVVDDKNTFRSENFERAIACMVHQDTPVEARAKGSGRDGGDFDLAAKKQQKKRKSQGATNEIYKIIRMLMDRHYEPVIVFSFSKKECETYALQMSKLDLCEQDEKDLIKQIFQNAIDSLSADDRQLPQVENILPLLLRGIGIHHGGLLPILKEVIEILFQEGLLKVLFSTETFSMGLNMPAKTVVFTALRKYDGDTFRTISSGEYIQMSGRAGRRGKDDRGICILMLNDETIEPVTVKNMIQGAADRLDSAFRLSYNMILNLLRVEDQTPIKLMIRSFAQFQNTRKLPALEKKLQKYENERNEFLKRIDDKYRSQISEYYQIKQDLQKYTQRMQSIVTQPHHILPFINSRRLVKVVINGKAQAHDDTGMKNTNNENGVVELDTYSGGDRNYGWGVIAGHNKRVLAKGLTSSNEVNRDTFKYIVDVLLYVDKNTIPSEDDGRDKSMASKIRKSLTPNKQPLPSSSSTAGVWSIVQIELCDIAAISSIRLRSKDIVRSSAERERAGMEIKEVIKSFQSKKLATQLPLLDPIEDMKISESSFLRSIKAIQRLEQRLYAHPLYKSDKLPELYAAYELQLSAEKKMNDVKEAIKDASTDITMYENLRKMTRVLRRLQHTESSTDDRSGAVSYVISNKGRVAAEISTADELLATELMYSNVYSDLTTQQTVALVSCLVYNERNEEEVKLPPELERGYKQLEECAHRVGQVQYDAGAEIDVEEYVRGFQPHLMNVVYAWCHGAKFSEICKMTDIFEGSIIRALRRLEELLRQYASAAKSVGNKDLEMKFTTGIELLKRDIVFAASLYL